MSWKDPARVEKLKRLWANGLSASQVAAQLGGVTRNSVISKIHRLCLPARTNNPARHNGRRSTKRKPLATVPPPTRVDKVRALVADGLPIPPPAEFDVPRIATMDLESHHCRFPCVSDVKEVGPFTPIFCGLKPAKGLPYCTEHALRAYALPRPHPPATPMIAPVVQEELEAA
jgi:GcrA cell cycle regulator